MSRWLALVAIFSGLGFSVSWGAENVVADGFVAGGDQTRIHVLQSGNADAQRSLLLIPGWRVSAQIWSHQLRALPSSGYRVVAIDSRSQGRSTVAVRNAPEDRAVDIHSVIAELHIQHLTLVGWSQGAQDVAAYVDHFGVAEVDHFVLVDSPVSSGPADIAENPNFVKVILQGLNSYHADPAAYTDGMLHAIITSAPTTETFDQLNREAANTPTDVGISMLVQDVLTVDRRPALKKFAKPTLVVASAESRLLDEQKAMAKKLPAGRFTVIDHAGHAVFFDRPQEFDQRLDDFIRSTDASGKSEGIDPTMAH